MGNCPKGGDHEPGNQTRENAGRGKIRIIVKCIKCGTTLEDYIVPGEHC